MYEYVLAMRAMGGASEHDGLPSELYRPSSGRASPAGSATTGVSGGSSLGLQYKGGWCTPPRIFVDSQDEVAPHLKPGRVPSNIDPDATERGKLPRRAVKHSAWKLAKLDRNEALKAAAKARASSSVLRPVGNHALPDYSSSENMSIHSSISTDLGAAKGDLRTSSMRNSVAPSQGSQDDYETGTRSMSSFSSPSHVHESVTLSPLLRAHVISHLKAAGAGPSYNLAETSTSTSKVALHSVDPVIKVPSVLHEKKIQKVTRTDPLLLSASTTGLLRDVKRTSVVWDQEAGRYVSVPATANDNKE